MNLREAVELARVDWDQADPAATARSTYEATRSIRNTLHLGEGRDAWVDYGDDESAAYRRVLEASDAEVEALRDVSDAL